MFVPPSDLNDVKRVQTIDPPASIRADVDKMVIDAAAQLSPGKNNALVPVFHWREGKIAGNLALVHRSKVGKKVDVRVVGYIGKEWGQPVSAGGAGIIEW